MADVKELLVELKLQNEQLIGAVSETKAKMGGLEKQQTRLQKSSKLLKAGYLALAGVITGVIARGLGGLVRKAAEAQETLSKFNTVFKDIQREANLVAKNLSRNFGLSALEARRLLSSTGDLLVGFGFTQKSALELSEEVNKLAVDLASFTNFSGGAAGASEALTKALLGERESLKSLGISILEADVKAKVLENTQKGLTFETERQAKAYATLQLAQQQTQAAQGDFQRTSTSFQNQMRILRGNLENLAVSIGNKLLPIFSPFVKLLNNILTPARELEDVTNDLANAQKEYTGIVKRLTEQQENLTDAERDSLEIRRKLLKLDILALIEEAADKVDDLVTDTRILNRVTKENERTFDQLGKRLKKATGDTFTFTNAEARLVGSTREVVTQIDQWNKETRTITVNQVKLRQALALYNKGAQNAANTQKKLNDATGRFDDFARQVGEALKNNVITELNLSVLGEKRIAQIKKRAKELEIEDRNREKADRAREKRQREQADRDRRLARELKERQKLLREAEKLELDRFLELNKLKNKALREAIDEEKEIRRELEDFKKIAREGEEGFEENIFQQKINRINQLMQLERTTNAERAFLTKARIELENRLEQQKATQQIAATKSSLGAIGSLTSSSNKQLFEIGKTASIAQAVINVAEAVTKTFTAIPFPLNVPLAAGQAAAGAVQIAKIREQQPPKFQAGGVIDRVAPASIQGEDGIIGARVGESILNVNATAQLGREAVDALNAGQSIRPQVTINVENGEGAVEVLNDYFKQFGTSERGEAV
jgi:hypothetical protein